eukprot:877664-Alexandrium_andersonii.AAC.1
MVALTSPGVAPTANNARARSTASSGAGAVDARRPPNPSWGPAGASIKFMMYVISSSTSSLVSA